QVWASIGLAMIGLVSACGGATTDPVSEGDAGVAPSACEDGATKPMPNCGECTCAAGQWQCTDIYCQEPECVVGEINPADDGCNTCSCSDGQWACTERACAPAECEEGQSEAIDECNTC